MTTAKDLNDVLPTVRVRCEVTKGNPDGVVEINTADYIEGKHQLVDEKQASLAFAASEANKPVTALGSNVLPETLDVGLDTPMPSLTISSLAYGQSGLSVTDWNALDDATREKKIATKLEEIRTANGYKPPASPFGPK